MKKAWKTTLIWIFCFAQIAFLVWAFFYFRGKSTVTIVAVPPLHPAFALTPAIQEQRQLTLEFPLVIRAGDADVIRLAFEMGDVGTLNPGGSFPNVFGTHHVMVEARLEMPGVDIRPDTTISETLLPGQKVTFYWSVLPAEVGKYKGTVWFYLRFIPMQGGDEQRLALSAQQIDIEVTSILGIKADLARWLGVGGTLLGLFLAFPYLVLAFRWVSNQIQNSS